MNTKTHALVVGIEKYNYPDPSWSVSGPCANALAITEWLLSIKTPPCNVNLFLSPIQDLSQRINTLKKRGVRITCPANWETIDTFYRQQLPTNCPAKSRLLVYWSGHGFTSKTRNRIFICGDYTQELKTRVFNATNFLLNLRSSTYQCFTDQIFFADACAIYSDLPLVDTIEAPERLDATQQLACFATPEGQYAYSSNGRGLFTETVLEVLRQTKGWPLDRQAFWNTLENALKRIGETPFRISGFDNNQERTETLVGSVPNETGNEFFKSVYILLSGINLPDSVFRPHYLRTVNDLGNPALANAQGLTGMIRELSLLSDALISGQVPHGLLQFLSRLAQEDSLKQPIGEWLANNAKAQDLATIRQRLQVEGQSKILVVRVEDDKKNKITGYQPFLKNSDFSAVKGWETHVTTVNEWDDFQQMFQQLLVKLRDEGWLCNLQIHFSVDPPLFHRPFHQIPVSPEGIPLGEQFVVLLRYRSREVLFSNQGLREPWERWADALRPLLPKRLKLVKIDSGISILPRNQGLCFTSFVLTPADEASVTYNDEKRIMARLLRYGAPYLYWPHRLPAGADEKTIKKNLKKMLKLLPTLAAFPGLLMRERNRGNEFASHATLLWDDPQFSPSS